MDIRAKASRKVQSGIPVKRPESDKVSPTDLDWYAGLPERQQSLTGGLLRENLNGAIGGRDIFPNFRN